jgi:hypothetical protein
MDQASLDQAQWDFKEYEINIVDIVGKEVYKHILQEYQCVIVDSEQLRNKIITQSDGHDVVRLFSS